MVVRDARELASQCRDAILREVPDVQMADIHLDVLGESPQSMAEVAVEQATPDDAVDVVAMESDGDQLLTLRGPLRQAPRAGTPAQRPEPE